MNIYVALLLAYSAGLTLFGLWIARKVRGPAEFFVAGRNLPWPLITATMLAANIGAGATVNATGLAYREGVSAWFWSGSSGLASLVLAFVVGPRIWQLAKERGYLTVGDFLEDRYGPSVRVVITSLIWVGTLFMLASQLLVGASVFSVVAGLPKWAGVLIGGVAMTGYFTAGGLLSSVWVSTVQVTVKFIGFAIAIPLMLKGVGGFAGIQQAPNLPAGFFDPLFSSGADSGFTMLLLLAPNFIVSPGLVQKIYGAKDARAIRIGVGLNGGMLLLFAFLPVMLGLIARAAFPGIEARDQVLPTLLLHGLPVWLGALALSAVFSAEVGTCDAILFMLSTSLSQDLYKRFINPDAAPSKVLLVARCAALIGGVAGMLLAINVLKSILDGLVIFYSLIGATLFVPVIAGLFSKSGGTRGALWSIVCGMAALLAVRFGTNHTGWWNPSLWGIVASATGFIVASSVRGRDQRRLPA